MPFGSIGYDFSAQPLSQKIAAHERQTSSKSAALTAFIPRTGSKTMGRGIMETAVHRNEMTPEPQMLHGPERGQPYSHARPSSSSGTLQLRMPYTSPVKSYTVARGISVQFPQHVSQILSTADALRDSHKFDATTSFPQDNATSQAPSGHAPRTSADSGTRIASSDLGKGAAVADRNEPADVKDDADDSEFELEDAQLLFSSSISIATNISSRSNSPENSDRSSRPPLTIQTLPARSGSPMLENDAGPRTPSVSSQMSSAQEESNRFYSRSEDAEAISPVPSVASTSTERPPLVVGVQLDDDYPIYSIGPIKVFNKMQRAIETQYEARWDIIYLEICDRVLSRLRRRRFGVMPNMPRANIQLMSAGVTKDTSTPAVVVVIPKHINMMQDFLNKDSIVQNLCRPKDGVTVELQILACKDRATLIGRPGETILSSDSDSAYLSDAEDTITSSDDSDDCAVVNSMTSAPGLDADSMCVLLEKRNSIGSVKSGLSIRLVTKDGLRYVRGTCGGILQLETPYHPPRRVGLVAGHILEQLSVTSNDEVHEALEAHSITGEILYPRTSQEIPRHDWALFDAADLGFQDAMGSQHTITIAKVLDFPKEDTVVNIRTSRGEVSGTLTSSTSGILLNPDQGFIHVRVIIMDRGSAITKGDSGAWVVHEESGKIYGLVIATNSNGDAYMVPLHAVVSEIEAALGVSNVSLATKPDPSYQSQPTIANEHLRQTEGSMSLLEAQKKTRSSEDLNVAKGLNKLAEKCLVIGSVEKAIQLLEKAVSIHERLPKGDKGRLTSKHELGRAYSRSGRVLEGIRILEDVTKTRGEVLGHTHPDCRESQHELAFAYMQNGQPSEAIKILEHVVTTEEATLDKANMDLLTSQHELSRAYLANGKAVKAVTLIEHVVAVKMSKLAESHPKLLASQIVLAEAELMTGRVSDAAKLLEHVVAIADASCSDHGLRTMARKWLKFAQQKALRSELLATTSTSELFATTSTSEQWRHVFGRMGSANPSLTATATATSLEGPLTPPPVTGSGGGESPPLFKNRSAAAIRWELATSRYTSR